MKKKSSIIIILLAVVIGAIHIKSQVLTEAEKAEAIKETKKRITKNRKYVLDLHKSDLIKYKSQYEEDSSNINALTLVTEKYWLIAEAYKDLDKRLGRQPSTDLIENNMNKSLQHLEELDSKMSEGWDDPEFRDKNEKTVIQLIKFYHHLNKNIPRSVHWRKKYLDYLMAKWDGGQKDRETACWIHNMYSTISTYIPYTQKDLKLEWSQKSSNWYYTIVKTFPIVEGRKRRCYLPYYF